MHNRRIIFALFMIYFVFAILLNSVGTVILQVINHYGVSKSEASVLEGFKDIPIAIVSFLIASFLPRIGYKKAMLIALAIVGVASAVMPLLPGFLMAKMLFLCVGISFALVKVSAYSTLGLVTADRKQHAGTMNMLEGFFMLGVLSGYWIFSYFIDPTDLHSARWLHVYWVLAILCALTFLLIFSTPFDERPARASTSGLSEDFSNMLKLFLRPLVCVYIISAFLYVLIEQGIGTWLPTFNNEILKLPVAMSVQVTSIYAGCLAVGRLGAGVLMRKLNWYPVLSACLISMAALVLLTLPLTHHIVADPSINWLNAPVAAYIFPLIGLFMAPIYPGINSVMLSSLPKHQHSAMTGLLVIFSALGGTTGSMITGYVFGAMNGQLAFYLSLLPIGVILVTLYFFKRAVDKLE
ncbi:MFS transporter [Undibacterium sp.]|jgi:FHS family glucose/mannose:H+ symporter-like MFS transporter|uniref:MFS transporter n=1 Tax=Undibacterium sp. TaxID=1914977 RepID=UPI002B975935|nr:MFS transporter [Undibacterium sp.]HTD06906.1 MFS transporter [Undibacterium sp.]